jgi:hypothetical protein
MVSLTDLHLRAARACIASAVTPPEVDSVLGSIRLREDQCASAGRVLAALDRDGGCLLADDVGTGKTYVALAVARLWTLPLAVVPASLRSTWREAMSRAGVRCDVTSHETLSRGRIPHGVYDGIIVDESHRFRSTTARRHAALATLCARSRLLLLSATPLQNRARDLAAQIALFHGARAFRLEAHQLARFVVRAGETADGTLPRVAPPVRMHPCVDDETVLREILALPSPVAPADGGDAGALRTLTLVRVWSSSRAALAEMLRRRRQVATAMEQCLADGLLPTRTELRAWYGADAAVQLGFASLLAAGTSQGQMVSRADVEREQQALALLLRTMSVAPDPDVGRAALLREVCAAHPRARVLAFTELASTARAYYRLLAPQAGVGLLTSRDARIASGRLPRDALLSRFAPHARHAQEPPVHERVTLLITTDLLSEGVNLQDASVVVHLDLPWNPARLAQRVGRVRRPGGAAVVHAYLMAPPASTELLLDVEQRLRRKLAASAAVIGRGFDVVPRLADPVTLDDSAAFGFATLHGEAMSRVAGWRRPIRRDKRPSHPIIAAVESELPGWLAALSDGRIITGLDSRLDDPEAALAVAVSRCDGPGRPIRDAERARCMLECQRRLDAEDISRMCGREEERSELSAAIDRRIALTLRHAPRLERATIAASGQRLRALARAPKPLGLERALQDLLERRAAPGDSGWLPAAHALMAGEQPRMDRDVNPHIVALIVLGRSR